MKFNLVCLSGQFMSSVGAIHELPRQRQNELPRQRQNELPRLNQNKLPRLTIEKNSKKYMKQKL